MPRAAVPVQPSNAILLHALVAVTEDWAGLETCRDSFAVHVSGTPYSMHACMDACQHPCVRVCTQQHNNVRLHSVAHYLMLAGCLCHASEASKGNCDAPHDRRHRRPHPMPSRAASPSSSSVNTLSSASACGKLSNCQPQQANFPCPPAFATVIDNALPVPIAIPVEMNLASGKAHQVVYHPN